VDAVAQVGMSEALRQRLQAAEAELARMTDRAGRAPRIDVERVTQPGGGHVQATAARSRRRAAGRGVDRDRVRALLAEILGPVVLRRDDEGDWAEMEEPAQRVLMTGSTPLTVVARACNVRRKLIRARGAGAGAVP
jgi:hypothetical protein